MRVTLLHNPESGESHPSADELCSLIENAGHHVSYCSFEDDWKRCLERESDLVAVAGGDGAVCNVLAELPGKGPPATIIPLGSANNIATALGLVHHTAEELVEGWSTAPRSRYDLGEPGKFAESAGCGLFAAMLERGSDGPSGEDKVEHGLHVLRELVEGAQAEPWRIELDGVERSGALLAVEAMLIGVTGPGVVLAPLADSSDGLFDVVLIGEEDRPELARYVADRLARRATRPPRLPLERAREVVIHPEGRPLRVDDDLLDEPAARARFSTGHLWVEVVTPRA